MIPAAIKNDPDPNLSDNRKIILGFIDIGILTAANPTQFTNAVKDIFLDAWEDRDQYLKSLQQNKYNQTIDFNSKMAAAVSYFNDIA